MAKLSSELLEEIVALSTGCLLVVDAAGPEARIVFANPAYETLSGYGSAELEGTAWLSRAAPDDDAPELVRLRRSLACGEAVEFSLPFLRRDAEIWLARMRLTPLKAAGPEHRLWLVEHRSDDRASGDNAELLKRALGSARRKLASLDRVDSVTGLVSRSHFELLLKHGLAVARRERRALCLMVFDVPELDTYRQTFGDNAADSCLRMVGAQIAGTFRRASDLCARLEGSVLIAAVLDQENSQAAELAALVERKVRNLGLHNPRGRLGRYIYLRSAWVRSDPEEDQVEPLIAKTMSALEAVSAGEPRSAAG